MRTEKKVYAIACMLFVLLTATVSAQDKKEDNSGTNPVNFTYDFRMWMEVESMAGDNSFTKTTFEYRAPLSKTVATRFRGYKIDVSLGSGASAATTTGFGDMDARVIWVPRVSQRGAIALGMEATFNTASQEILGTGKTTLGPQAFLVFFQPFGIKGSILAPAYQYVFDIAGDDDRADISRSAIDIFFVWLAANKKHWVTVNPTVIIDHENEK